MSGYDEQDEAADRIWDEAQEGLRRMKRSLLIAAPVVLVIASIIALVIIALADRSEARALPVRPVHAHAVKTDPTHDCGNYRFTAKVPTTEVGLDGKAHAGVSIQVKWGDPHWVDGDGKHIYRTGKPGYWESKRACLAGIGTATPKPGEKVTRVKVVGYFDPCAVDGSGDIFEGIAHDLVDDDRALDGKVRHQKVRIHVPAKVLAGCDR